MIVTCTPTIQDGQVLRWYASENATRLDDALASVSRNAILVEGSLAEITPLIGDLERAYARIRGDEDVSDLATHDRRGLFGELEPIVRAGEVVP